MKYKAGDIVVVKHFPGLKTFYSKGFQNVLCTITSVDRTTYGVETELGILVFNDSHVTVSADDLSDLEKAAFGVNE